MSMVSYDIMGGWSLGCITTIKSLVIISIMIVNIEWFCHVTSNDRMFKDLCDYMG